MRTRKAILPDAQHIHELIAAYSGDGTLLPRTLPEICENVQRLRGARRQGVASSVAAHFTCMVRTWRRSDRSRLRRGRRAKAAADAW